MWRSSALPDGMSCRKLLLAAALAVSSSSFSICCTHLKTFANLYRLHTGNGPGGAMCRSVWAAGEGA